MRTPIVYLFVPGNRPDRFDKALNSGADAIIVDLEDAVDPSAKALARDAFAEWFEKNRAQAQQILLRINDAQTADFSRDLELVRSTGVHGVMLPKTESPEQVEMLGSELAPGGFIVPIIESALGILEGWNIARARRIARLAFGNLDYAADLQIAGDARSLAYPSSLLSIISRAAGLAAPISGVTPEINDDSKLQEDTLFARRFGFGAKLCIHPRQIGLVRQAFTPTEEEVDWAERVIVAAIAGNSTGAAQLDGKMIDRPVILRAQTILQYKK